MDPQLGPAASEFGFDFHKPSEYSILLFGSIDQIGIDHIRKDHQGISIDHIEVKSENGHLFSARAQQCPGMGCQVGVDPVRSTLPVAFSLQFLKGIINENTIHLLQEFIRLQL